jgi:uncharacterized protein YgbK (DUF1537 family)
LIAKGGITSSDVDTKGLSVKKATVAGQVKLGIPVWLGMSVQDTFKTWTLSTTIASIVAFAGAMKWS